MRFGTRIYIALIAVLLALTWVLGAASSPGTPSALSKQNVVSQDDQARKDFNILNARIQQGEQLSLAEEEQFKVLYERFGTPERQDNPLDDTGGPDAFGYSFVDNLAGDTATYNWIELRGDSGATWVSAWASYDDGCASAAHPIGFSFPFYGSNYTTFTPTSNGAIDFGTCYAYAYYSCLPNASDPATIYPCLYDLHLQRGGYSTGNNVVGYKNFGTYTVIEYDSIGFYSSSYTGSSLKFEVILYNTGWIKIQYNNMVYAGGAVMGTVGIQNAAGATNLQYRCYNQGNTVRPLNNGRAIWFHNQPPVRVQVTGNVTLDGGSGTVTNATLQADGFGNPLAHPLANGNYTLDSVQVGNRIIITTLTGYESDTVSVNVPEGGANNVNFTLRRLPPPVPTGLVGSVNNGTGLVSLNWDNSTDPLVDIYRVYRKLASEQNWTLIHTRFSSGDSTDVLSVAGIYQYTVTAVDTNVVPPAVESPRAVPITLLYGNLPPSNLVANGNFDDRIRLNWLSPGIHQSYQLAYDDSSSEVWFSVYGQGVPNGPQDYFAVRFTPPSMDTVSYPLPVQTVNIYLQNTTPLANVWLAADAGGVPDLDNPLMNWQDAAADNSPGWFTGHVDGQVTLNDDNDFWVVLQFPPATLGPGCGSDNSAPDSRSYWAYAVDWPLWHSWTSTDWMMRVWVGGEPGWGNVLSVGSPFGYSVDRVPSAQTAPSPEMLKLSGEQRTQQGKISGPVRVFASGKSSSLSYGPMNPFPVALKGALEPFSHAPSLVYQQDPRGGRALDDIVYYKLYKDGTFLANDTIPPYDDVVTSAGENISHTYWVRAHYDNNQDSDTSNHAVGRANMAPGAPTALDGNPVGSSQMQLTWTDPAVNADGTPCVDLASVRIYRDGTLIGTVAAGVHQFTDTPPQPDMFYTWTVRGVDEVPNEGVPSAGFIGAVTSPWQSCDYDWIDISGQGTTLPLTDDSYSNALNIGFSFTFYDQEYTQLKVASNGFLTFDLNDAFPPYIESAIPNSATPNNAVYYFWDDMNPSAGGTISYLSDPTNGQFIVSYVNVPHYSSGETYTYQAILGEDGSIIMNYQTIPINNSCSIGVEDATGSNGIQVVYDGDGWLPTNQSAVCFWAGPSGELQGIVRQFGTNAPLQGVRVGIMEGPEFTMTDATGFYSLPLEPATYTVNYSRQGNCDSTIANVVIEDNNATVRNMTLRSPSAQFSVTSISQGTWPTHDASVIFQISNNGGQCALDFSISDTSAWLTTNPVSGSVPPNQSLDITVNMSVQGLTPGTDYQSALTIQHEALGSPYVIPVTLSISLEAPEPNSVPTEFALYQNYPNPFNATTSIRFDVPQENRVIVTLFNVMGQAVATVVDGQYAAGRHSVSYDAADLPSGMYLMKLDAGSFTSMKKMMLLK